MTTPTNLAFCRCCAIRLPEDRKTGVCDPCAKNCNPLPLKNSGP